MNKFNHIEATLFLKNNLTHMQHGYDIDEVHTIHWDHRIVKGVNYLLVTNDCIVYIEKWKTFQNNPSLAIKRSQKFYNPEEAIAYYNLVS